MGGFLVPDHFVAVAPSPLEMNMASLVWGLFLGFALFSAAKGVRQTAGVWRRKRTVNAYVFMIWAEWTASFIISPACWFFLWGVIPVSFWTFFWILVLWVFQMQCIIQIIINRIALLVRDQRHIRRLQWGTGFIIACINISVFVIWIPAQLQISQQWIEINHVWDRVEKVIFAILDVCLNIYFIHLVKSKLIANGLTKYNRLFYANCTMIAISLSLDVILIGTMSIGSGFLYVQFHPLVYIIKLFIEMNMADLIAKTVRGDGAGAANSSEYSYPSNSQGLTGTGKQNKSKSKTGAASKGDTKIAGVNVRMQTLVTARHDDDHNAIGRDGIHRTVETTVVHEHKDDDTASRTSSTEELQKKFGIV